MKKIIYSLAAVLCILTLLPFASFAEGEAAHAEPISWYDFEDSENLGKDKMGNNDLLILGNPVTDDGDTAPLGKAIFLDGESALYAAEDENKFDFADKLMTEGTQLSFAFWVQHEVTDYDVFPDNSWRRIISNGHDGAAVQDDTGSAFGGYTIIDLADNYIVPGAVITYMMMDSGEQHGKIAQGTNYAYKEGQWDFLVYTVDTATGEIDYLVNGVSILGDAAKKNNIGNGMRLYNTARPFSIGGNAFLNPETGEMAPNHMFCGSLDEVMVFNTVLTADDIAYYMELTGADLPEPEITETEPEETNPKVTKPESTKDADTTAEKGDDTTAGSVDTGNNTAEKDGLSTGALIGIIAAVVFVVAVVIVIIVKKKK